MYVATSLSHYFSISMVLAWLYNRCSISNTKCAIRLKLGQWLDLHVSRANEMYRKLDFHKNPILSKSGHIYTIKLYAPTLYTEIHTYMHKDHMTVTWPTDSLAVDEDVWALQVSVEKSLRMAVVQCFHQLTCQALDVELREANHARLEQTTQVMITVLKH